MRLKLYREIEGDKNLMDPGQLAAIVLGLIQLAASIPLVLLADKMPPNPLIGFRISYAMISRQAWHRLNRLAGLVLALIGASSVPIGLLAGIGYEAVFLAIGDIAASIALTEYARRYAEKESISLPAHGPEEARPIPRLSRGQSALLLATALAAGILTIMVVSEFARELPLISLMLGSLLCLPAYFTYLSLRRPEAYALPWLSDRAHKALTALLPPGLSLLVVAIDALTLRYNYVGFPALIASLALVLASAYIVVKEYLEKHP